MTDDKDTRRVAIIEELETLARLERTHEAGKVLGSPAMGTPFVMGRIREQRADLERQLKQLDDGGEGGEA